MPRKNFNRVQVQRCVSVLDELARIGRPRPALACAQWLKAALAFELARLRQRPRVAL